MALVSAQKDAADLATRIALAQTLPEAMQAAQRWLADQHPGASLEIAVEQPAGGSDSGTDVITQELGNGRNLQLHLGGNASPDVVVQARLVLAAVTRAALAERERRRSHELTRLRATAKHVAASLKLEDVLDAIVRDATALLNADSGDMLLLDRASGTLRVVAVSNFAPDMVGFTIAFGEGISSQAILARRPLQVDDYRAYPFRVDRLLEQYDFRAVLCAPLLFRGAAIGALNVHAMRPDHRFEPEDADLLAAFADHAAIAIDHARRYENEVRLAQDLETANRDLTRSLTLQQELADVVLSGSGFGGIAARLAALLELPVVLQDSFWHLIAGAAPGGEEAWRQLIVPRTAGLRQQIDGEGRVVRVGTSDQRRFAVAVRIGRETLGYLVLPADPRLAPLNLALVEIAATGVALEFAKTRAAAEAEQRVQGEVATDLVTGSFATEEAIAARMAKLGYDPYEPRTVLVIDFDAPEAEPAGAPAQSMGRPEMLHAAIAVLRAELSRRAPGSLVFSHADAIVVLLAHGADPPEPGSVREKANRLQQQLASHNRDMVATIAIGDGCAAPGDYPASFTLAREALLLNRKLGRRAAIADAASLGGSRLILKAADRSELVAFADRTLGSLVEHDRRAGSELVTTLRAYLEEGGVQRRAAERCMVHVNTVVYRLRKIQDLLGLDLGDPQTTLDLMLALKISDLQESM